MHRRLPSTCDLLSTARARRLARRALGVTLVAWLALGVWSARAYADDDEPPSRGAVSDHAATDQDSVKQLTDAEREFLASRVPGWAELEPAKQQRIARNVVRMRTMTPAEKERLAGHIAEMRNKGGSEMRGKGGLQDSATRALIARALAREARRTLGEDFARRLQQRDVSDQAFENTFSWAFWRRVNEHRSASGDPVAPEALPAGFPDRWRAHYAKEHARWIATAESEGERSSLARRLHLKVVMFEAEDFRTRLGRTDLSGDEYLDAIGSELRQRWPEAFASSIEKPDALIEAADQYELKRSIQRVLRRSGRLEKEEAVVLVRLLDRLAAEHRKGDGAAPADALLKQVLMRELGVPEAALADLPAADQTAERQEFLLELARRHRLRALATAGTPSDGSSRRRPPGARRGGFGERPDDVSEADWAIWVAARKERADGDGFRHLMQNKPEGMTDAGWEAVRASLRGR
ncbi:MAG: DUF3106 domain-containing protein [Planctomycetota bacterium]|nr:DUF3106 domain-containing protein [Planctomycetota bacterium]